jgi:hypothetical protein
MGENKQRFKQKSVLTRAASGLRVFLNRRRTKKGAAAATPSFLSG